jgi:polyphosphate kinase 2 (PPK2 family)
VHENILNIITIFLLNYLVAKFQALLNILQGWHAALQDVTIEITLVALARRVARTVGTPAA